MPRIRTIKPEFWTDEKVVQLPFRARLFFIGMWNFADDDGRLLNEPERLKMQIFPGDSVDVEALVDLLSAAEMIEVYALADGRSVIAIPNFARHQKISHASPSRLDIKRGRKQAVPATVRQAVATKYGCKPGTTLECHCHQCGAPGEIIWWRRRDGRPSGWVSFSGVHISKTIPEFSGMEFEVKSLVLSCKFCSQSGGHESSPELMRKIAEAIPESALQISAPFRPEGKGREGKGRGSSEKDEVSFSASPIGVAKDSQVGKAKEQSESLFPPSNETAKSYTPHPSKLVENLNTEPPPKPPSPDDRTWLFNEGLVWLAEAQGRTPKAMRSSMGGWLKECGDDPEPLRRLIEDAAKLRPADPTAWITKAIQARTKPPKPNGHDEPPAQTYVSEDDVWRHRMRGFVDRGFWIDTWGKIPRAKYSMVPPDIILEFAAELAKIPKPEEIDYDAMREEWNRKKLEAAEAGKIRPLENGAAKKEAHE